MIIRTEKRTLHGRKTANVSSPANASTILGIKQSSLGKTIERLAEGLPFECIHNLQKISDLPLDQILKAINLPRRTLFRRKASGRLAPEESEQLYRLANLIAKAVGLFEGDMAGGIRWLNIPAPALGYVTPLSVAGTDLGTREVENIIIRLEHGVYM